jgi:lauroyl/myristoyl acyltransferase
MNEENEKRRAFVASLLDSGSVRGDSRVRLFPFRVRNEGDEHFVMRRDQGGLICANGIGVASLFLLKRGYTLDMVRSELVKRYGFTPENVDIGPLLISLAYADFIRQIDDHVISTTTRPLHAWLWARVSSAVKARTVVHAVKLIPLPLVLRLVYRKQRLDQKSLARTEAMFRGALLHTHTDEQIRILAARHSEGMRHFYTDRLLLSVLSPTKLDLWLRDYVRIDGLEHLQSASAEGEGVVICGFHFGSFCMLPFILGRLGYPLTVFTSAGKSEIGTFERRLAHLSAEGLPYSFVMVSGVTGLRTVARKLERGETVLMMCDTSDAPSHSGQTVAFLGRRLSAQPGLAWLASKTRARIVPCVLRREHTYRHQLEFYKALTPSANSRDQSALHQITASAYAILEDVVLREPWQWHRWPDFDSMSLPEGVPG